MMTRQQEIGSISKPVVLGTQEEGREQGASGKDETRDVTPSERQVVFPASENSKALDG